MKVLQYLEPLISDKNKISIRRVLALLFSFDFVMNMSYIVHKWQEGKSFGDAAMLIGVEAGLIAALLSLTTYSQIKNKNESTIE